MQIIVFSYGMLENRRLQILQAVKGSKENNVYVANGASILPSPICFPLIYV